MLATCPECGHVFNTEYWLDMNRPLQVGTCFECKRTDVPGYWVTISMHRLRVFKCVYCMGRNE